MQSINHRDITKLTSFYHRLLPITIWSNFAHAQRRDVIFGEFIQLRKLWNSAKKKFDAAGKAKTTTTCVRRDN